MRIDAAQDAVTGGCGVNICVSFDQNGGMYATSSACPMGSASPNGGGLRADIGEIGSDSRDSRIADEITAFIVHNRALTLPGGSPHEPQSISDAAGSCDAWRHAIRRTGTHCTRC